MAADTPWNLVLSEFELSAIHCLDEGIRPVWNPAALRVRQWNAVEKFVPSKSCEPLDWPWVRSRHSDHMAHGWSPRECDLPRDRALAGAVAERVLE